MNNCLLTTLKESVQNDNLPILGKLRAIVTTDYENTPGNTLFRATGGTREFPAGITPPDAEHAYYGNYTAFVANKYNLTELYCGLCVQFDTAELSVLDVVDFRVCNFRNDLSLLAGLKCSNSFSIANYEGVFDIADVLGVVSPKFNFGSCTNAQGDVISFGNKTDLVQLYISGANGIGGDLLEFAKAQINNGRDNCTGISMAYLNTNPELKFNGVAVTGIRAADNSLSWVYDSSTQVYTITLGGSSGTRTATYVK